MGSGKAGGVLLTPPSLCPRAWFPWLTHQCHLLPHISYAEMADFSLSPGGLWAQLAQIPHVGSFEKKTGHLHETSGRNLSHCCFSVFCLKGNLNEKDPEERTR